jgi:ribosomal protein S18 acetylase RimI-like enzyme
VEIEVRTGGEEDVDSLEPLWKGMVEHHRAVVAEPQLVRDAARAWALRRRQYLSWLANGNGFLLLAQTADSPQPVGYCFCELTEAGPTFDLGEQIGDVGSLAVAPEARGAGVGTALLRACRSELTRRAIAYWSIGVVEGNCGALSLYERVGFRPMFRTLLAPVDDGG